MNKSVLWLNYYLTCDIMFVYTNAECQMMFVAHLRMLIKPSDREWWGIVAPITTTTKTAISIHTAIASQHALHLVQVTKWVHEYKIHATHAWALYPIVLCHNEFGYSIHKTYVVFIEIGNGKMGSTSGIAHRSTNIFTKRTLERVFAPIVVTTNRTDRPRVMPYDHQMEKNKKNEF